MALEKRAHVNEDRAEQLAELLKQAQYISSESEAKYEEVGLDDRCVCGCLIPSQGVTPSTPLSAWCVVLCSYPLSVCSIQSTASVGKPAVRRR